MRRALIQTLALVIIVSQGSIAQTNPNSANANKPLTFKKKQIASESFESVGVFDVNNDKIPDIVSGAFWYEGPGYWKRTNIGNVKRAACLSTHKPWL